DRGTANARDSDAQHIWRCERDGLITGDQPDAVTASVEAHLAEVEPGPILDPSLQRVLEAWQDLGSPVAMILGMAGGMLDQRAPLYVARLAWLNENRYDDTETRDAMIWLWSTMDREQIRIESEAAA